MLGIIIDLIIGAVIGAIAGKLMDNKKMGFWKNAFLGVFGGLIGGVAANLLHLNGAAMQFFLSVAGSCLIIFAARKLSK